MDTSRRTNSYNLVKKILRLEVRRMKLPLQQRFLLSSPAFSRETQGRNKMLSIKNSGCFERRGMAGQLRAGRIKFHWLGCLGDTQKPSGRGPGQLGSGDPA